MSFFDGPPDGSTQGRTELARKIAEQGRAFAERELRWEEMQSFMLLFLLEVRRDLICVERTLTRFA